MTKDELVVRIFRRLPYSNQISKLDTESEADAIRFSWRGDGFRVSVGGLSVEQVNDGTLSGSNLAILMEFLLRSER